MRTLQTVKATANNRREHLIYVKPDLLPVRHLRLALPCLDLASCSCLVYLLALAA